MTFKGLRNVLIAIAVTVILSPVLCNFECRAQSLLNCGKICSGSGACHFYRAMDLLRGLTYGEYGPDESRCIEPEHARIDAMAPIARTELGISELEKIIGNQYGVVIPQINLRLDYAAAKISLSQLYAASGNYVSAGTSLDEAANFYHSLYPKEGLSPKSRDLIINIVTGLIRCGRNLDALEILNKFPSNDPDREYLSAEAFFNMGNRSVAAGHYEQWLALGCNSRMLMIRDDEYGPEWDYLLLVGPKPPLTLCEQLPPELRTRFESLKEQFGHPKIIPVRNYPPMLMRRFRG